MLICLTNDQNARNIIAKLSKTSCELAGANTYYLGIDRTTGMKRYLIHEKDATKIKQTIECEIMAI